MQDFLHAVATLNGCLEKAKEEVRASGSSYKHLVLTALYEIQKNVGGVAQKVDDFSYAVDRLDPPDGTPKSTAEMEAIAYPQQAKAGSYRMRVDEPADGESIGSSDSSVYSVQDDEEEEESEEEEEEEARPRSQKPTKRLHDHDHDDESVDEKTPAKPTKRRKTDYIDDEAVHAPKTRPRALSDDERSERSEEAEL